MMDDEAVLSFKPRKNHLYYFSLGPFWPVWNTTQNWVALRQKQSTVVVKRPNRRAKDARLLASHALHTRELSDATLCWRCAYYIVLPQWWACRELRCSRLMMTFYSAHKKGLRSNGSKRRVIHAMLGCLALMPYTHENLAMQCHVETFKKVV